MNDNIMNPKPGQKTMIVTHGSVFLNCDCMFIEYDDVIKSPFFVFLEAVKDNDVLSNIFDLTDINGLDIDALYEWYTNRKNQNIFKCLTLRKEALETYFHNDRKTFENWCDTVLYDFINNNDYFVKMNSELNFVNTLVSIMKKNMVPKYYVYTPIESTVIKEDLIEEYGDRITYVHGDLTQVLKENKITSNSTFVFSDISKITALKEAGILHLSSVLIADKYGYNYKDSQSLSVDIKKLAENSYFKLDFFDNINMLE